MLGVQCFPALDSLAALIQCAFFIPHSLLQQLSASNSALRETTGGLGEGGIPHSAICNRTGFCVACRVKHRRVERGKTFTRISTAARPGTNVPGHGPVPVLARAKFRRPSC